MPNTLSLYLLLTILLLAVLVDLRTRRIPNLLIVSGFGLGLVCAVAQHGLTGLPHALGGATVAIVLLLPMFAMRAIGAGDVKLLAVVGSFAGPVAFLLVLLYTFLAGGILAIAVIVSTGRVAVVLDNLRLLVTTLSLRRYGGDGALPDMTVSTGARLPYALAIAVGALAWMIRHQELLR